MQNKTAEQRERRLLLAAVADSVLEVSDEEFLAELREDGLDPQEMVAKVDCILDAAVLEFKKGRLAQAKKEHARKTRAAENVKQLVLGNFEENFARLREWVQSKVDAGAGNAVLQFRDLDSMKPEDVESAVQQLVQLGEIDLEDR